jgi:nucleotide-binding universal stress UspA family protein
MALGAGLPDPAAVAEQTVTAAVVAARRHGRDVPIAGEAVHGPAADVLGAACTTADLLVLGSHGHSRLHTAVLGSVSEACVRLATCPVLIIPAMRTVPAGSRAVAVPASG